jgi:lysophospholipase L1-like esterase
MPATTRRNLLFGSAVLIILFALIELTLRLVVHFSVNYFSDRENVNYEYKLWQMHLFDSFMGMQQPDPDLFWRMKPGYQSPFISINSDGFSGPPIRPKEVGEFRILFLGDSTPLGLGLPRADGSYVWEVGSLLQQAFPDRRINVINAAVAGYTSWQCRRLLELHGESLNPDMVITYFGNNDPSYNGYLSDRQLYESMRRYGWLNRLLARSYSYQILKSLALRLKSTPGGAPTVQPRVSPVDFRENLEAIKNWCDQHRHRLLVCTIPTPSLWPPGIQFRVFSKGRDSSGRLVMAEEMQGDLTSQWALCLDRLLLPGTGDQWTRRIYQSGYRDPGDPAENERACRSALAKSPNDPRLLNNLGVAVWQQGRDAIGSFVAALARDSPNPTALYNLGIALYRTEQTRAQAFLERAREQDHYSLRIKSAYNQILRSFSNERAVPLIDLETDFVGLKQSDYFVDHCHPTGLGHALIAHRIADQIAAPGL